MKTLILLCAWVMWSQGGLGLGDRASPVDGHASKRECEARVQHLLGEYAKMAGAWRLGDVVFMTGKDYRGEDYTRTFYYTCLPDTIDPRK